MDLIELTNRTPAYEAPADKKRVAAAVSTLIELGVPGAPYCLPQLFWRLAAAGVVDATDIIGSMDVLQHALYTLVRTQGWQRHRHWPFYTPPGKNGATSLPLILTHAVVPGVVQNIPSLGSLVVQLTGVDQTPGTLRKTMSRLVQQEVYRRAGEGLYINQAVGVSV